MKIISCLLFALCFNISLLYAQQECIPESESLEVNLLNAPLNPLYLWRDSEDSQFFYPQNDSTTIAFAGGFWVTGQHPDTSIRSSVMELGLSSNLFDYQAGPVGTGGTFTSSTYFCKSFKILKSQVNAHLLDLVDGTLDEPIPAILEWPGRDNVLLPSTAFGKDLAPFIDANNDGVYQPEIGDYPDFRGDEAIWWVSNDFGSHQETMSDPVGIEMQVLAQAFIAPNHPAAKSHLYSVKVINEADVSIDSLALSFWADTDIGCFGDDAVGTIPSRNIIYAYNTDAIDGISGSICERSVPTYMGIPPVVFMQTLSPLLNEREPMVRNSGIAFSRSAWFLRDPQLKEEVFNYTHGLWLDGTPLTFGGNGYSGTAPTNWIYSGNPADTLAWSQCRSGGGDRRTLLNVNLQESFEPGAVFSSDFILSVVDDIVVPCPDISAVIPTLDSITDYLQNTVVSSNQTPNASFKSLSLKPNPARNVFEISIGAGQEALQSATLFDGLGRVVEQYSANVLTGVINVAHLPRGVYSLIARDAKGEMYRSRVVLQ